MIARYRSNSAVEMSGFEVAGIALGVLPIVLQSIDSYKDSIRRVGTAIRKRKYVEKLARALLLQQQILEETIKSVLLACGCEDMSALEDNPFEYFHDEDIQERVGDYLGPKNSIAFLGLLNANNEIIKRVAVNIAGLVPTHQVDNPSPDLLVVCCRQESSLNSYIGTYRRFDCNYQCQSRKAKHADGSSSAGKAAVRNN